MTVGAFKLFRLALAVGAGYEIGRMLPPAVAIAFNKRNRAHYKSMYRDGMRDYERKQSVIRVVPDQPETPTGV